LSATSFSPVSGRPAAAQKQRSVLLVFGCTVLGAAAQILMKMGANQMVHPSAAHSGPLGILTNLPLLTGYALYGLSTLLLVLALKDGELSLLYPVIALTYVWVTVLSFVIFHDALNAFRLAGITIIVAGVAIIGRASRA
jgi:multidrug transporter EmrE-like cation transporter